MTLTLWSDWLREHPDTTVLDVETGVYPGESYAPESGNDSAYFAYRHQKTTLFPVPDRSETLGTKDKVFGLVFGDEARAYPFSMFDGAAVVNDELGGRNVLILETGDGSGVRAYARENHVFTLSETSTATGPGLILTDEQGANWQAEEDALVSLEGSARSLERLPSRDAYRFGWYAFYPQTGVYSP